MREGSEHHSGSVRILFRRSTRYLQYDLVWHGPRHSSTQAPGLQHESLCYSPSTMRNALPSTARWYKGSCGATFRLCEQSKNQDYFAAHPYTYRLSMGVSHTRLEVRMLVNHVMYLWSTPQTFQYIHNRALRTPVHVPVSRIDLSPRQRLKMLFDASLPPTASSVMAATVIQFRPFWRGNRHYGSV
jgi:hypothetical protein